MKLKKFFSALLSVCLVIGTSVSVVTVTVAAETKSEVIFQDDFSAATLNTSLWESHGESLVDGTMLVSNGDWPTLKMPVLETDSAYRFSYKVMAAGTGGAGAHELLKVMHSDAANNGRSFGSYRPGYGFTFKSLNWANDLGYSGSNVTANNVWYIVETEFCEIDGAQYTKWTVKDAVGNELYTDTVNSLWNANSATATAASVSGGKIWFYNNAGSTALDIYVDDVTLEKITESEVQTSTIYEQNFDGVGDIKGLTSDGIWTRPVGVDIVDGALEVSANGYIYFDIKNKNSYTAYKMSYDIMTPSKGNGKGGLNVFAEGGTSWSLGFFNSVEGLSGIKHGYDDKSHVISGTTAGKWYTVKVEFCENASAGYVIYTLIDRDTQKVLGTYTPQKFEAMDSASIVSGNHTHFCIWNRDGADEIYYIDNIKLEVQGEKPVFQADNVVIRDIAGNEITDLAAPITPGIAEIVLDFSAEVTQESAESGVSVAECGSDGSETLMDVSGVVDGSKYILSFSDLLKENTKYIIKISKTIKTENGDGLSNDCVVEFQTGKASCAIAGEGLYVGDAKITSAEEIGAGAPVNVKAKVLNATSAAKQVAICITYFKGNKMVATSLALENIAAQSGALLEKEFTTPSDMAGVDTMQIVFWNSATEMLPYCNSMLLSR